MLRVLSFYCLFITSFFVQASSSSPLYQIDMIVFKHLKTEANASVLNTLTLAPNRQNAIELENDLKNQLTPYHTLPSSASGLKNEYWALSRKPDYQVLLHYTWLQPRNNQRSVAFSQINNSTWNIEGTLNVRQSNYYLLNTNILFSAPNNVNRAFMFSQTQRLKPDVVYYLDHPEAGMLIKIHQVT